MNRSKIMCLTFALTSVFTFSPFRAAAGDDQTHMSISDYVETDRTINFADLETSAPDELPESAELWSNSLVSSHCDSGCAAYECDQCDPEPWRLFGSTPRGFQVYGWVDQGFSANARNSTPPAAGFGNLPVTFNYRNDYQLNQLYVVAEKETDSASCDWSFGGRVDVLYGEDYIFTTAAGLERRPNGTNHWAEAQAINGGGGGGGINGSSRLNLALPQAYGEIAKNNWKLKLGHFYTIIGNEVVTSPDNFFYSHAYTMQYGEPFTHTGGLLTMQPNESWTIHAGIVNGWDKFDAVTDRPSFLGGVTWTSYDERTSLAFSLITGEEDGTSTPTLGNRTMYSIVFSHQLNQWQYILQHDLGVQANGVSATQDASWYGINQYLLYTINDSWKAGVRYEWFNDQNGTRVTTSGGHWHEIAAGLNWTPRRNVIVRPEARWDWADFHSPTAPPGPFDNFTRRSQFVGAVDVILQF